MLQFRSGLDLQQESLDTDELGEIAVHHLDGDFAVVPHVVREIHVGHTA